MHDLSSCVNKARRPVRNCELLPRALGGSQPESALSSCYSRQALRVFLSGADSPNFQRFLAFFLDVSIILLPNAHRTFTHGCILTSEFFFVLWSYVPDCLLDSFLYWLHFFLFPGSSLQADTWFTASPDIWLLSYPLSYSQYHPQTSPESQLTPHLLNICGLGLSERHKGSGALGNGRYGELEEGHSPWGQVRMVTGAWKGLCKQKKRFL